MRSVNWLQEYEEQFGQELELNASINSYVRSYELDFNGPNTIRYQLGVHDPSFDEEGILSTAP